MLFYTVIKIILKRKHATIGEICTQYFCSFYLMVEFSELLCYLVF